MNNKITLKDITQKVSLDILYHEYIELNIDKKDLSEKYSLRPGEWFLLKKLDTRFCKPTYLSRMKSKQRGKITRQKALDANEREPSCKEFINIHKIEIQIFADEGKSIFEIFNYYQEKYHPRWKDYPTFGAELRKVGIQYSDSAKKIVDKTRRKHASESMKVKSSQEKYAIQLKRRNTLELGRKELFKDNKLSYKSYRSYPEICLKSMFQYLYFDTELEYISDRYPYNCDIYIPRFDLFIELNAYWSHGKHPYDPTSEEDNIKLAKWHEQEKIWGENNKTSNRKNPYSEVIETWTVRDPAKLATAKNNKLNYLALYNVTEKNQIILSYVPIEMFHGFNIIDVQELYDKYIDDMRY